MPAAAPASTGTAVETGSGVTTAPAASPSPSGREATESGFARTPAEAGIAVGGEAAGSAVTEHRIAAEDGGEVTATDSQQSDSTTTEGSRLSTESDTGDEQSALEKLNASAESRQEGRTEQGFEERVGDRVVRRALEANPGR